MTDKTVSLNEEDMPGAPTPQVVILGNTVTRHGGDTTATMDRADWEALSQAEQQAWAAAGAPSEPSTEEIEDAG